ncbi:MAG: hypothetical protein LM601_01400 [Candidatus Verstraetearchaeota archaeon]|nr:hypothetical protein [Candidatus Verstraetearchaeota archaeon]
MKEAIVNYATEIFINLFTYLPTGVSMVRKKTSIYVDEEIWMEFKRYAVDKGMDVSSLIEEILREELLSHIDDALSKIAGSEDYQINFEPIEPRGSVSALIREMRNERASGLPR